MVERNTIYAALFFVICLLLIFSTENEKTTEIESFYHEPWRAGKNISENDFIFENDICDPISKLFNFNLKIIIFSNFYWLFQIIKGQKSFWKRKLSILINLKFTLCNPAPYIIGNHKNRIS